MRVRSTRFKGYFQPCYAAYARRREKMEDKGAAAWKPAARDRKVSKSLEAYAAKTTSAARGAVRDVSQRQKQTQTVASVAGKH